MMTTSALLIALLTACAGITAAISGAIGMAGGVTLLAIMTLVMPLSLVIPIHGVVQLVSNSTRATLLRHRVRWPVVGWFVLGLPAGALVAVKLIEEIDSREPFLLLIALLILYTVFKPKRLPGLRIPFWGFVFVGAVVGFLSLLIGATGPFIAPFFLRDDFTKENIVATKASVQVAGHVLKIPAFLYLGFDYQAHWLLMACMVLATVIGTKVGLYLLGRLDQTLFNRIFKIALFLAALRLLYKAATHWLTLVSG